MAVRAPRCIVVFFNDAATTEIYTLSLHDALPICAAEARAGTRTLPGAVDVAILFCDLKDFTAYADTQGDEAAVAAIEQDRKSTRLNSSHGYISYAVFCLKKKNNSTSLLTTANKLP